MPTHFEMNKFVKGVIEEAKLDGRSQDITLEIFNAIRDIPAIEQRYLALGGGYKSALNPKIAKAIARVLHKENLKPIDVKHKYLTRYMRFKPQE
ncbi:MAG: hypothetical protein GC179_23045 [Anaerolineaceae bacterium]|nr:hypothetical protein [Anaerolineaceae bacterium]